MTIWTIGELMHLTRDELCAIASSIESALPVFAIGTIDRLNALVSLDNIRRVMILRNLHF